MRNTQIVLALVIALAGGGMLALRDGSTASAGGNRALADVAATTKVIADVSSALTKVFTYTAEDTGAAGQAAAETLRGRAAADYRLMFAQVQREAPDQRLTLTTRVVRIGVSRLSGNTAHLLAFLDQVSTRDGKPNGSVAAAQLSVTATFEDGLWRITDLTSR